LVVITGGPPFNLGKLMEIHQDVILQKWIGQGGFACDSIVPKEYRLSKFDGQEICMAANFSSAVMVTKLLTSERIQKKVLVSKNVCHGISYNKKVHQRVDAVKNKTKGLQLIFEGMNHYLIKNPAGKKFHDPLAAVVALRPEVCQFKEVEMYYTKKKEWGCIAKEGTNTFISIYGDNDMFVETLCQV